MSVALTIDGKQVEVPAGSSILDAAETIGVEIPRLCHHPDQKLKAVCRICVVEIEGSRLMQPACAFPVSEGMIVHTSSAKVITARKTILELMLAHHPKDCLICERNLNCELQGLAEKLGITKISFPQTARQFPLDDSSASIIRDPAKCINCRRCLEACNEMQGVGVLSPVNRGYDTVVSTELNKPLTDVACSLCGQCVQACPVGALKEKDHTSRVWEALANPHKHVVVQTAPAVRVALGEEFGLPVGTRVTKKMIAALRRLGFDRVFDTNFTADLTIMEEGSELLERIRNGGKLPMITSCSPGWIKFIEHFYPELLDHLSSCKSPQQMFGSLAKTYYASKTEIDPKDVYVVSIMPCTAKKFEANRPEMNASGYQDVDAVLTTHELGKMIKQAGIDFSKLPDEEFDAPLGISTGAAVIFGATGGVMEAALRTVYELVTGAPLDKLEFESIRGLDGIKTATVELNLPEVAATTETTSTLKVKVAVAHSLAKAKELLELVKNGEQEFHFIEIMSCPGGCIGGGGQPRPTTQEKRQLRSRAIYNEDESTTLRKSHENPIVQTLYDEFLTKPLSEISHRLLHTHYTKRSRY